MEVPRDRLSRARRKQQGDDVMDEACRQKTRCAVCFRHCVLGLAACAERGPATGVDELVVVRDAVVQLVPVLHQHRARFDAGIEPLSIHNRIPLKRIENWAKPDRLRTSRFQAAHRYRRQRQPARGDRDRRECPGGHAWAVT